MKVCVASVDIQLSFWLRELLHSQTLLNRIYSLLSSCSHLSILYESVIDAMYSILLITLVTAFLFDGAHCDQKVLNTFNDIENKTSGFLVHESPFGDSDKTLKREKRHLLWPNGISKVLFYKHFSLISCFLFSLHPSPPLPPLSSKRILPIFPGAHFSSGFSTFSSFYTFVFFILCLAILPKLRLSWVF